MKVKQREVITESELKNKIKIKARKSYPDA